MKSLLLSAAALAIAAQSLNAASLDNATWYSGSGYTTKTLMSNRTATSLTYVWGEVENGFFSFPYDFDNPNNDKKVKISGPNGYEYSSYPTAVMVWDDAIQDTDQVTNMFRICIASLGTNTPGTYTVTFPEGCMNMNGAPLEAQTIEFYINDGRTFSPTDIKFSCNPDESIPQATLPGVRLSYDINWPSGSRRYTPQPTSSEVSPYFEKADGTKINAKATNVSSVSGTGCVEIIPTAVITEPGEYTMVVPQGVIRLSEMADGSSTASLVCNKELKYVFTVEGGKDYAESDLKPLFNPEPGNVAKLTRLQLETPNEYVDMYLPDKVLPISVKNPNGIVSHYNPYTNQNVNGLFVFVDFGENCSAPGTYQVTFPRGCFEYFDGSKYTINKEFTVNYQVLDVQTRDFSYTVTPENGSTVYKLYNIEMIFADKDLTFTAGTKALVKKPDGTTEQQLITFGKINSKLIIDMGETMQYGDYEITIPESSLLDLDGMANKAITLKYTLAERLPQDIAFTIDPAEGKVLKLDIFTITAPDDVVKLEPTYGGITRVSFRTMVNDPDNELGYTEQSEYLKSTGEATSYRVILTKAVKELGDYALVLPENTFIVTKADGTQCINTQKVFTWTVVDEAGVENIYSENGTYDVYTLAGVLVYKGTDAATLKTLKGLYIINGKNYLLK